MCNFSIAKWPRFPAAPRPACSVVADQAHPRGMGVAGVRDQRGTRLRKLPAVSGLRVLRQLARRGTLALLPVFLVGLVVARRGLTDTRAWMRSEERRGASRATRLGRLGLLATGAGLTLAGSVIMVLGATEVFVAEDLGFMGMSRGALAEVNARLIPLIAHDRAGFGGGLATTGVLLLICGWYARPSRAFHQATALSGLAGFGCAIGTHFVEGYLNPVHLAPAFLGAALFGASIVLMSIGHRADQEAR